MVKTMRKYFFSEGRRRRTPGKSARVVASFLWVIAQGHAPAIAAVNEQKPVVAQDAQKQIARLDKEAQALYAKGNAQEAVVVWGKAVELAGAGEAESPSQIEMMTRLFSAYARMGSQYFPLAEKLIERVISVDPNVSTAYLVQGDICFENGEIECALGNYDLLLHLNPEYANAVRVNQKILALEGLKNKPSRTSVRPSGYRGKYVYRIKGEVDWPGFDFYVTTDMDSYLARIDILRGNDTMVFQSLLFEDSEIQCKAPASDDKSFEVKDFNGDGYNDVKILCPSGEAGKGYLYFLYDRKSALFMLFNGGMLPDQARSRGAREIHTYERPSEAESRRVERVYALSGGRLVLMKEVIQGKAEIHEGRKAYRRTINERRQDVMTSASETWIAAEGK